MKFTKMLKLMLKDPTLKFENVELHAKDQDLSCIRHWFCVDSVEEHRVESFKKFTESRCWEIEEK